MWETVADVRIFGMWKTVVAFVNCEELDASFDGVAAVWVTVVMLVSDVCVAATVCESDVCAAATIVRQRRLRVR
jgi:hypothetical protein